jgi:DNA-directed RNA polymerase subunit M/transcription elongation factor TFIIS
MISKCVLILLFLFSVVLLLITIQSQTNCMIQGGRRRRKRKSGSGSKNEDPIYVKLIELDLNKKEAEELAKDIIDIASEYSENPFVVATKMDKVIRKLDKKSLAEIQKDKEHIKVLLEISSDGTEEIRVIEEQEEATSCDLYECPRCGGRKHTYKEIQARSIDEPSNIKCLCQICGMKYDAESND